MSKVLIQKEVSIKSRAILMNIDANDIKKALRETAGLWHGKKIDPLRYQRAMRKSYAGDQKMK